MHVDGDADEVGHVRDVEHAGVGFRAGCRRDHVVPERREAVGNVPERRLADLTDSSEVPAAAGRVLAECAYTAYANSSTQQQTGPKHMSHFIFVFIILRPQVQR